MRNGKLLNFPMNNCKINIIIIFFFFLLKVNFAQSQNPKGEWTFGFSSGFVISDNLESSCGTCAGINVTTTSQYFMPYRFSLGYTINKSVSIPVLLSIDNTHFEVYGIPDLYSNPNKIEFEDLERKENNFNLTSGIIFTINKSEKKRISVFFLVSCALTKIYRNKYFYYYSGNTFVEKGIGLNAPRFIFDAGIKLSFIGESKLKNLELVIFPSQSLDISQPPHNSFSVNLGLQYSIPKRNRK